MIITGKKFEYKAVKEEVKIWMKDTFGIEAQVKEAWKIADEINFN